MYQWRKDIVTWKVRDTLYVSVPFTWLLPKAEEIAQTHKGKVIAGGPAVALMGAPWADETPAKCIFDVMAFYNPLMTKTSRGCSRGCAFCGVARIEGEFHELETWKLAPVVCDSNLLLCSPLHFNRVIDSLKVFPHVDFQGIQAALVYPAQARRFAEFNYVTIRMGFDNLCEEEYVIHAIEFLRREGIKDIRIYILIGFDDTPDEAKYKLELVRSWGIRPTPMRYQPLDTIKKNSYVAPGWSDLELRRMTRYYSRLCWLEHIPYEDFEYLGTEEVQAEIPF